MSCSSAKAMSQYFPGGVRTVHSLYRTVHILSRLARCPSFARDSLVYSSGPVTDLCRCAKGRVSYWPRRRQWGGYGCCLRLSVSLSVFFRTISENPMQLGSPNSIQKCFKMSPGNLFILGSEGQRSRSRVTETLPTWIFALFWVLASNTM